MRFQFNGATYTIEFQRDHRQVRSGYDATTGQEILVPSKYPYTTVVIFEQRPDAVGGILRTATVGAYHKEKNFDHKEGNLRALRLVSKGFNRPEDRAFKQVLWEAYMNRGKKG